MLIDIIEEKLEEELIEKSEKRNYVSKSNDFIRKFRSKMSFKEHQLFYFLLLHICKEDTSFRERTFTYSEILKTLKLSDTDEARTVVEKAFTSMRELTYWCNEENGKKFTLGILSHVSTSPTSISVEIDKGLIKYLLNLQGNFTKLPFKYIISGIKSRYTVPLYEYLRSTAFIGKKLHKDVHGDYIVPDGYTWTIKIKATELREIFNCESKYKDWKDFMKKVINVAKKEINMYADINITGIIPIKNGRSITGLNFVCEFKKAEPAVKDRRRKKPSLNEHVKEEIDKEALEYATEMLMTDEDALQANFPDDYNPDDETGEQEEMKVKKKKKTKKSNKDKYDEAIANYGTIPIPEYEDF